MGQYILTCKIYRYSKITILSGTLLLVDSAVLLLHAPLVKHSCSILEVGLTHVLRRFFETSNGFILEYLKLLTHLIIAYFIKLLGLFVVHSSLDEVRVRLLRRCKLVEQECRVWVSEEASEIAFAVFVADIANEIKICVVVLLFYLLKRVLDKFIALVVSVREQEQDEHVYQALLDGGAQRGKEIVEDNILQVCPDAIVHRLLLHFHRQFILWEIPRKCVLIVLILQSKGCACEVEFPLVVVLLVELYVHRRLLFIAVA
jgi:uncharacterized membrane protein